MCRERIWYDVIDEHEKKQILLAFKNETKIVKKIPVFNSNNEEISKIIKLEPYSSYIDFYLEDYVCDSELSKNGKIQLLELYDKETNKGLQKRIKRIIA